ncbi:hypothetical protein GOV04_01620 [Candidatus Woesearchaeota archaeon]|nr:hypothetical protein [Candidatus Woesearchaeota archaeon]
MNKGSLTVICIALMILSSIAVSASWELISSELVLKEGDSTFVGAYSVEVYSVDVDEQSAALKIYNTNRKEISLDDKIVKPTKEWVYRNIKVQALAIFDDEAGRDTVVINTLFDQQIKVLNEFVPPIIKVGEDNEGTFAYENTGEPVNLKIIFYPQNKLVINPDQAVLRLAKGERGEVDFNLYTNKTGNYSLRVRVMQDDLQVMQMFYSTLAVVDLSSKSITKEINSDSTAPIITGAATLEPQDVIVQDVKVVDQSSGLEIIEYEENDGKSRMPQVIGVTLLIIAFLVIVSALRKKV